MRYLLLALFGLAGLFARYFCNSFIHTTFDRPLFVSTLMINILGSFLMGITYVVAVERLQLNEDMRIAIMVGFLGSFTTFSAFSMDTMGLLEDGRYQSGMSYALGSTLGSVSACYLGMLLCRRIMF